MAAVSLERRGIAAPASRFPSPWLLLLPLGLALAVLPALVSGAAVAAIVGAALVLARPHWGLYLVALTVPYQSLADVKVNRSSVSITEAAIVLVLAAWLPHLVSGRAARPRVSALLVAVGGLLVAFALSVFVASDLSLSTKELLKWLELAAVYLAGTSLLQTPGRRRVMLAWLIGAAVSQAVVGLAQSVLRIGPDHFMIGGVLMRAYGTFEQPNPFGGYLGLILPVCVALVLFGLKPGGWRRAALVACGVLAIALLLTLSRGAWTGQAVALLLVLVVGSRTARHALLTFGIGALLMAAVLWPLLPPELSQRLSSVVTNAIDIGSLPNETVTPENWSVLERLSQWYAGWHMFTDNPILGVGIGNYNAAYENYGLDQWPVALGHAHNHYLTIAAEAGVVGLLAYLAFLAAAFRSGVRAFGLAPDRLGRAAAAGILGSLASFATHNLFDVLFVHGMGVTIGLLLALLEVIPRGMENAEDAVDHTGEDARRRPEERPHDRS